jgi:hypothetical protein
MKPSQKETLLNESLLQGIKSGLSFAQTGVNGCQISGWHVVAFAHGIQGLETTCGLLPVFQYG